MRAMTTTSTSAMPVPVLDREAFQQVVSVPALRVPTKQCHELMKKFRGFTYDKPKTKCIVHDGQRQGTRLLLLREELTLTGLSEELQRLLQQEQFEWDSYSLKLEYSHMPADAVLKTLLPTGMDIPSSFELVGHIAHLNLREEQLPYKTIIGQVIMDKNPHVKTVVNKVGSIDNEYRVFQMEVIAGDDNLETEVVQHKARFRLDFSKVYWNSRLETEHHRLVQLFQQHQVVVDVMAGIGPFAIPAALKGCKVFANDLNPASYKYLQQNIKLNKLSNAITAFNMDGRAFVRQLLGAGLQQPTNSQQQQQQQAASPSNGTGAQHGSSSDSQHPIQPVFFHHAVMNLPASAVEFLDAFHGAFDPAQWRGRLPTIHCYTFMKDETEQDVIARVERALGGCLDKPPSIHHVRDVAPSKIMLCVSFTVPEAVAFAGATEQLSSNWSACNGSNTMHTISNGNAAKKQKTSDT
eukprot:jgi/Chrzof1/13140/Cz07g21120.t1